MYPSTRLAAFPETRGAAVELVVLDFFGLDLGAASWAAELSAGGMLSNRSVATVTRPAA